MHTAVMGRADGLRTLNPDFYNPSVRDYCRQRGIVIANDVELLAFLRSTK